MILVTGGAGVLGSRLVKRLVAGGRRVRVLTLPGDPFVSRLADCGCEIVYGDVSEAPTLEGVCDGVETVYHLAAVIIAYDEKVLRRINVEGTRNMVDAASARGVDHFIYVSSAAVTNPLSSAYALSKVEGEEIVSSQGKMNYTVVRPTLIYERDGGQEFMMFLDYLKKYPVVPFVGAGRAMKRPVFADDIVTGLGAIAGNPRSYGKTYNFSGGEAISIAAFARLVLKHMGMSRPFLHLPLPLCRLLAALMERTMKRPPLTGYAISRIEEEADLDSSTAREDLGFDPLGVSEGLQRCWPLP